MPSLLPLCSSQCTSHLPCNAVDTANPATHPCIRSNRLGTARGPLSRLNADMTAATLRSPPIHTHITQLPILRLGTATGLLSLLDANMTAAAAGAEAGKARRADLDRKQEEMRRNIKVKSRLRRPRQRLDLWLHCVDMAVLLTYQRCACRARHSQTELELRNTGDLMLDEAFDVMDEDR